MKKKIFATILSTWFIAMPITAFASETSDTALILKPQQESEEYGYGMVIQEDVAGYRDGKNTYLFPVYDSNISNMDCESLIQRYNQSYLDFKETKGESDILEKEFINPLEEFDAQHWNSYFMDCGTFYEHVNNVYKMTDEEKVAYETAVKNGDGIFSYQAPFNKSDMNKFVFTSENAIDTTNYIKSIDSYIYTLTESDSASRTFNMAHIYNAGDIIGTEFNPQDFKILSHIETVTEQHDTSDWISKPALETDFCDTEILEVPNVKTFLIHEGQIVDEWQEGLNIVLSFYIPDVNPYQTYIPQSPILVEPEEGYPTGVRGGSYLMHNAVFYNMNNYISCLTKSFYLDKDADPAAIPPSDSNGPEQDSDSVSEEKTNQTPHLPIIAAIIACTAGGGLLLFYIFHPIKIHGNQEAIMQAFLKTDKDYDHYIEYLTNENIIMRVPHNTKMTISLSTVADTIVVKANDMEIFRYLMEAYMQKCILSICIKDWNWIFDFSSEK